VSGTAGARCRLTGSAGRILPGWCSWEHSSRGAAGAVRLGAREWFESERGNVSVPEVTLYNVKTTESKALAAIQAMNGAATELTLQERLEQAERDRAHLYQSWLRVDAALRKRSLEAMMWHGKYAIVKHENNALRRKLYRQGKTE
jgi:hypothetical protein